MFTICTLFLCYSKKNGLHLHFPLPFFFPKFLRIVSSSQLSSSGRGRSSHVGSELSHESDLKCSRFPFKTHPFVLLVARKMSFSKCSPQITLQSCQLVEKNRARRFTYPSKTAVVRSLYLLRHKLVPLKVIFFSG